MEERVVLLRVLHDNVVVRVLRTNAVLQCQVSAVVTRTLREGTLATVRVEAYNAPFVCVGVQADADGGNEEDGGATEPPPWQSDTGAWHAGRGAHPRKRPHFPSLRAQNKS